jgi:hypothetical protein
MTIQPIPLSKIINALPSLTPNERLAVGAALAALGAGKMPEASHTGGPVFDALAALMRGRGGGRVLAYTTFKAAKGNKGWNENSANFEKFVAKNFPQVRTKTKQHAFYLFLMGLIVHDLQVMKVPITMLTLAQNLGRVGDIFEKSFPNYLASGMGKMVVDSLFKSALI